MYGLASILPCVFCYRTSSGRHRSRRRQEEESGRDRSRSRGREKTRSRSGAAQHQEAVVRKFGLDESRYDDFSYLCYLEIENVYVQNYVEFQLGKADPVIKGRISANETLEGIRYSSMVIRVTNIWG